MIEIISSIPPVPDSARFHFSTHGKFGISRRHLTGTPSERYVQICEIGSIVSALDGLCAFPCSASVSISVDHLSQTIEGVITLYSQLSKGIVEGGGV